jgi:hypothetical protein
VNKTTIIILMGIALGIMTIIATKKKYEFVTTTITETHTDTLYVELPTDTVYMDKVKYISNPIHDTVYINNEGEEITKYKGEFVVDSMVTVIYDIDIQGLIKGFNFGAIKNYPPQERITVNNTVTKTITKPMEYRALWGVIGINTMGSTSIGLSYQNYNKAFEVNYNPLDKIIGFNYKLRLFKTK